MHPRRLTFVAAVAIAAVASPARADQVGLADGRVLEGRLLAVGPERLVLDGSEGVSFHERAAVSALRDAEGRALEWAVAVDGEQDPAGVVRVVGDGVRVRRHDRDLTVSIHGSQAVVREGDLLRTGPYGRVRLLVPGGGVVTARNDALVRFRSALPELVEGTLHLEHPDGRAAAWIPEGRVEAVEGRVVLEHLRGATRITCLGGRAIFSAAAGYQIDLPRNHALDVTAGSEQEPASVAASNANAWPVRLESVGRFVSIQPGERVVLLGAPREAPVARPTPQPAPAQPPLPEQLTDAAPPPAEADAGPAPATRAGRVLRSTATFGLTRRGEPARQVDRAEAEGLELWQGDLVETDRGEVTLEAAQSRVRLLPGGRLQVAPPEGGAPFRLRGEATVETGAAAVVAVPGGEVGLLRGAAALRAGEAQTEVSVREGTAGARFGNDVRAELLPGSALRASPAGNRVSLEVPTGMPSVAATLGTLDLQLRPGQSVSHSRTGDLQVIALWNGARVELYGPIRARVTAGPEETSVLELVEDGRRFPLRAGTYRFARQGREVEVVSTPDGTSDEAAPAPRPLVEHPTTPPAEPAPTEPAPTEPAPVVARGRGRHVLPNGAVVHTRDWGDLEVERRAGDEVAVKGPAGTLWFGAGVEATLARQRSGEVRIDVGDGRYVVWSPDGGDFDLRLASGGALRVDVDRAGIRRAVEVEAGCEFDLLIHRNFVRAFVFGQVKYVEPGEAVSVTHRRGLRTHLAADRR